MKHTGISDVEHRKTYSEAIRDARLAGAINFKIGLINGKTCINLS